MIIDCHGHYTTAPKALKAWRDAQVANLNTPELGPKASDLKISDDEIRESIEENQLARMKERGIDVTIFSPQASFMTHHIGDFNTSATWAALCNELCYRVTQLFPKNFVGAAMLPQSPGVHVFLRCVNALMSSGLWELILIPIRQVVTGATPH
jgi:4-oxalmesaconate hydratase